MAILISIIWHNLFSKPHVMSYVWYYCMIYRRRYHNNLYFPSLSLALCSCILHVTFPLQFINTNISVSPLTFSRIFWFLYLFLFLSRYCALLISWSINLKGQSNKDIWTSSICTITEKHNLILHDNKFPQRSRYFHTQLLWVQEWCM